MRTSERPIANLKFNLPSFPMSDVGEVIGQRFLGNESHVEHFKLLERASTSILIGARNAIYNISLHDLTEIIDQVSTS
uniref:Uncharacterized protein n=1 Tax=Vespula pensylvanica TaxID=30213 RepID=A0A834NCA4_VESPE|nr:hypothetical protein H0235_015534 [Vespula pensylvanica]